MGPWMKPVVRWLKVAKSLQSLGSLMLSELAQWAECTLDSLSHHIAILTTSSRPTMDGFSTFPGFSSLSAPWLGVHLFLGLSLSCSPLGSLSSLLTLWRDPQWPLLLCWCLSSAPGSACYSFTHAGSWKEACSGAWGKVCPRKQILMPYEEDLSSSQG